MSYGWLGIVGSIVNIRLIVNELPKDLCFQVYLAVVQILSQHHEDRGQNHRQTREFNGGVSGRAFVHVKRVLAIHWLSINGSWLTTRAVENRVQSGRERTIESSERTQHSIISNHNGWTGNVSVL